MGFFFLAVKIIYLLALFNWHQINPRFGDDGWYEFMPDVSLLGRVKPSLFIFHSLNGTEYIASWFHISRLC